MTKNKNMAKISNDFLESLIKSNSATALKVVFYVAKSTLQVNNSEMMTFGIDTKELCSYCNIDVKTLRRNLKQMTKTSIKFEDEGGCRYISLMPYVDMRYNGQLEIRMFTEILSELLNVQNRFTIIDVSNVMRLSSKHSLKMIQLIERIASYSPSVAKRKRYGLDELNALFGVNYKRLVEFERNVIKPSKIELDKYSKISFDYRLEYDKENITTPGRAKAVSLVVDVVNNTPRPTLF